MKSLVPCSDKCFIIFFGLIKKRISKISVTYIFLHIILSDFTLKISELQYIQKLDDRGATLQVCK